MSHPCTCPFSFFHLVTRARLRGTCPTRLLPHATLVSPAFLASLDGVVSTLVSERCLGCPLFPSSPRRCWRCCRVFTCHTRVCRSVSHMHARVVFLLPLSLPVRRAALLLFTGISILTSFWHTSCAASCIMCSLANCVDNPILICVSTENRIRFASTCRAATNGAVPRGPASGPGSRASTRRG